MTPIPHHASHRGHGHSREQRAHRPQNALLSALAITLAVFGVEVVGGFASGSLALLSDAAHMLADVFALGLALFAVRFSTRRATPEKTFGYLRLEILAALVNGVVLSVLALSILHEAWQRFSAPTPVASGILLACAALGLVANLAAAAILHRSSGGINVRSALLHVMGDTLSSVAVLVGGTAMLLTGESWIDPALGGVIGIVLFGSAARLVREAVDVLLEAIPKGIDALEVNRVILAIDGVVGLHDLHIWSLTTGVEALSAHVIVRREDLAHTDRILEAINGALEARFRIAHTTIQVESNPTEHVCFAER